MRESSIAQLAERAAVNRKVFGSIPDGGANFFFFVLPLLSLTLDRSRARFAHFF